MAPFLAMADLERARVCSSGLTKTFFNFNQFPQLRNLNKDYSKDFDTQAKTGWKPNGFPSPGQHPEEERILVRIFFKDYVCGGWITDYFLRSNILKKISSKDF